MGRDRRKRWEWFSWFVLRRGLSTDFERRRAGALWLGLIFACGGADGNGWRNVGAVAVEGLGVDVDGVAVAAAAAAGGRGDDDAGVVGGVGAVAIAVVGGIGVEDGGRRRHCCLLLSLSLSRREAGGV